VGGRWKSDYLAGIGKKGEKFIILFDLAKLMSSDDALQSGLSGAAMAA
jgi:purine-binding chemotaxis protein CheW